MLHKAFVILWLAFLSLWLGVIAPGHERGSIRMAGMESAACHLAKPGQVTATQAGPNQTAATPFDAPASCCVRPAASQTAPGDAKAGDASQEGHEEAPVDPASCCAICYLNSVLNTPEPLVFVRVFDGLLEELEPLEPAALSSISARFSLHIRGPPLQLA